MLIYNGKISLYSFLSTALLSLLLFLPTFCLNEDCLTPHLWWILPTYYKLLNILLFFCLQGFTYQVAIRSAFLGLVFSIGIFVSVLAGPSWKVFGWYMCFMALFHYSEFLMIAITNPRTLSLDSFILNHSREYAVAAVASWLEFLIERWFFPGMKQLTFISLVGLILCTGGEVLRKLAMLTAKTNFNHMVQSVREEGHQLVTHGVYSLCRHPSYVGWFYWSIGTQLILINPVCIIAYTIASWRFFHERIIVEEMTLLNFFGEDYYNYQKRVCTGLPFIHGYKVEL
ncbi:protein-S-isoprenylcysteine O-methyltransferase [Anabrus simplex]|uniref:protein-S-isoprenylcysteine O-methyltransferase n=1 Tax=Anabrus simplex TaxID=316456 RepID=UPI0035A309F5